MDRTNEPGGLRLSVTHRDDADAQTVRGRLRAYNAAALPRFFDRGAEPPRVNVYLRDEAGTLVGGITGQVEWTQLAIAYLWVDEAWRGQGLGRGLVQRAEEEARALGCTYAALTTFDFQAPGFYTKLGYRVVGQVDDYPPGHTYYLLRHDFAT